MPFSIYIHQTPSGKNYVGQTCTSITRRWRKNGIGYKGSPAIQNAIAKYGWDNMSHEVIFTVETQEESNRAEELLVNVLRSNKKGYGYNCRQGGGNKGKHSTESIKKMSESKKGVKFSEEHKRNISISKSGENSPCYGKPKSDAVKKKIGMANGKVVQQFDDDGNLIAEYYSAAEASRKIGKPNAHITDCCRGVRKHCQGYVWKFKEGGESIANGSTESA